MNTNIFFTYYLYISRIFFCFRVVIEKIVPFSFALLVNYSRLQYNYSLPKVKEALQNIVMSKIPLKVQNTPPELNHNVQA